MDKQKIIDLIDSYWRFDNDQNHTSTWHDKEALIKAIENIDEPSELKSFTNYCESRDIKPKRFSWIDIIRDFKKLTPHP